LLLLLHLPSLLHFAFLVVIPQGSAFVFASAVACFSLIKPQIVIPTEAPHGLIVRRAAEKSAVVFAFRRCRLLFSKLTKTQLSFWP
jgi:hypothetical protein